MIQLTLGESLLDVATVAKRLGVSRQHVYNLIEEGSLEAIDLGTGTRHQYRVAPRFLDALARRKSTLSAPAN